MEQKERQIKSPNTHTDQKRDIGFTSVLSFFSHFLFCDVCFTNGLFFGRSSLNDSVELIHNAIVGEILVYLENIVIQFI